MAALFSIVIVVAAGFVLLYHYHPILCLIDVNLEIGVLNCHFSAKRAKYPTKDIFHAEAKRFCVQ